jgi:hypothetical protein
MKKNIKKEIFQIIDNVAEQHKTIDSYETQIPQIELDIIMSNIRKLYESYTNLIKINQQQEVLKPKEEEPAEKIEIKEEKTLKFEPIVEDSEETIVSKTPDKTEKTKEKKEEKPITQKKPDLFSDTSSKTVADNFKNETESIYEKFARDDEGNSIGSQMQQKQISNLKDAIGINEKFNFIHELFDGVLNDYNEAIDKLNDLEELENALDFYTELKEKYKWDESKNSFIQLKNFIERKFI